MNYLRPFKYKLLLPAVGLVAALSFGLWLSAPSYLEIYIPIPSYRRDIWNYTQHTTFSYAGDSGVEYVLRREGTADTDVVDWHNAADGLSYLDRWLAERGWERTDIYTEVGDPALPETSFLKFGETYAVYTRPEDRSGFNGTVRGGEGRVTVAVWPRSQNTEPTACDVSGFNVVVVTVRPSFWRVLTHAFED